MSGFFRLLAAIPWRSIAGEAFSRASLVAQAFRPVVGRRVPEQRNNEMIERIVSGNLPPGFDSSTCRSVYVGNIHLQVTDTLLQEVFQSIGQVEGCKLIRKEKSSFDFIDYFDRRSAALAISSLNGKQLCGQPIKVNWAFTSTQREDTSGHFNIFGIFAQKSLMLLCLPFSLDILPAQMLGLCGTRKKGDAEGSVLFLSVLETELLLSSRG